MLRKLVWGMAVSVGCVVALSSCGLPFVPVDYHTHLILEVCSSGSPLVSSASTCEALSSNAASIRSEVVSRLESRSDASGAQSAITIRGDGDIDVQTTLATAQAVAVFTKTGSVAFATAVTGTPEPTNAAFLADQQGRFDTQQFRDPDLYPVGYHWKIELTNQLR